MPLCFRYILLASQSQNPRIGTPVLRFCAIGATKSYLNLSAWMHHLFNSRSLKPVFFSTKKPCTTWWRTFHFSHNSVKFLDLPRHLTSFFFSLLDIGALSLIIWSTVTSQYFLLFSSCWQLVSMEWQLVHFSVTIFLHLSPEEHPSRINRAITIRTVVLMGFIGSFLLWLLLFS